MELEAVFLSHFSIAKKPDIFELIGAAVQVGAWKHPVEFKKRRDGILKMLMNPGKRPGDAEGDEVMDSGGDEIELGDEEIDSGVDESELEDEPTDSEVDESELDDEVINTASVEFEKDDVTGTEIEDHEVINNAGTEIEEGEIIEGGVDDIEELAAEIEELVQEKVCRFGEDQEINNAGTEIEEGEIIEGGVDDIEELAAEIEELVQKKGCRFGEDQEKENISNIKSTVEQSSKHLKENKTQGGKYRIITSAMGSAATNKFTKRMSNLKQLHKQINTNAFKRRRQTTRERLRKKLGFKKMETDFVRHTHLNCDSDRAKKTEGTQQTPIQSNNQNATDYSKGPATKLCSAQGSKKRSSMTKMNVAIKRVELAPPHGNQLLADCFKHKKLEEGDQQLQKQNNCNNRDLKERWATKLESSKRKFDERVEEINIAKRRAIMVDCHDMPKPPKDPFAPRRCWDRRRF